MELNETINRKLWIINADKSISRKLKVKETGWKYVHTDNNPGRMLIEFIRWFEDATIFISTDNSSELY